MSRFVPVFVVATLASLMGTGELFAQVTSVEKQQECFADLKSSVLAVPAFSSLHDEVENLTYNDIQADISDYYKNVSSFGVDLRSPDFDMRVYSFGRDTGYQHPPYSPFPTYTLSDKWKTPAREYIFAEEYVRNTETNERMFISCAFMTIESMDLKGVTAERYLYDGALSSIRYTSPDQSFKVWYSSNDSYDHEGRNFVTWRRLFVYPRSTVNQFFDKYTVAEAFPAHTTTNLGDIKRYRSREHTPETRDLLFPPALSGYDTVFALNSYYQAIENSFPQFGTKLALRGVLDYGTVKELLATRGVSGFAALWQTVLDPREITKYALLKQQGALRPHDNNGVSEEGEESAFFEDQLKKIEGMTLEAEAQALLKTIPDRNPIIEDSGAETKQSFLQKYQNTIIGGGLLVAGLLTGLLLWLQRRRRVVKPIVVE